ncbi:MAG: hypothetical protein ABIR60_11755 [Allosphingosinicella sp.]
MRRGSAAIIDHDHVERDRQVRGGQRELRFVEVGQQSFAGGADLPTFSARSRGAAAPDAALPSALRVT